MHSFLVILSLLFTTLVPCVVRARSGASADARWE